MKSVINPVTLLKELKKMSLVVSKNTILPIAVCWHTYQNKKIMAANAVSAILVALLQ